MIGICVRGGILAAGLGMGGGGSVLCLVIAIIVLGSSSVLGKEEKCKRQVHGDLGITLWCRFWECIDWCN